MPIVFLSADETSNKLETGSNFGTELSYFLIETCGL